MRPPCKRWRRRLTLRDGRADAAARLRSWEVVDDNTVIQIRTTPTRRIPPYPEIGVDFDKASAKTAADPTPLLEIPPFRSALYRYQILRFK